MLKSGKSLLSLLCAAVFVCGAHAASATPIVFNFDGDTVGASFGMDTDPASGLTLTYAGAATVCRALGFSSLSGNALVAGGCTQQGVGEALLFSSPLSSLSFNYATNGPGTIDILVVLQGDPDALETLSLSPLAGDNFEGSINITGIGPFDTIFIDQGTVSGTAYALDNLSATLAPSVPEPSSMVLMGTGLLGFAGAARRRFLA